MLECKGHRKNWITKKRLEKKQGFWRALSYLGCRLQLLLVHRDWIYVLSVLSCFQEGMQISSHFRAYLDRSDNSLRVWASVNSRSCRKRISLLLTIVAFSRNRFAPLVGHNGSWRSGVGKPAINIHIYIHFSPATIQCHSGRHNLCEPGRCYNSKLPSWGNSYARDSLVQGCESRWTFGNNRWVETRKGKMFSRNLGLIPNSACIACDNACGYDINWGLRYVQRSTVFHGGR